MRSKKLASIHFKKNEGIFLVFNDDLADKIHEYGLEGEAMDLVSEIEKFMWKILDREDD